jgi:hypothetical protein
VVDQIDHPRVVEAARSAQMQHDARIEIARAEAHARAQVPKPGGKAKASKGQGRAPAVKGQPRPGKRRQSR